MLFFLLTCAFLPVLVNSQESTVGEEFRNRKGYFSMNVQAVCDADLKLMNVIARWPGSAHDATIFNNSVLRENNTCVNFINGQEGRCTPEKECPSAINDLRFNIRPQFCGTNSTSGIKRICCLEEEIQGTSEILKILRTHDECLSLQTINRKPKEPLTQGEKAWKMCLKYQNEAVFPCGIRRSDITRLDFCSYNHGNEDRTTSGGGVDAKSNEFPHMALLGYGKYFSEAEFNCGGSLISERFVLTAGHCTVSVGVGKVSFAVFGTLYRKRKPLQKYIYEVKTIIKHPMYKPPIKYNDIALLEMDRQVKFDAFVIPACLHVGDQVDDSRAYGTGWGIYDRSRTRATKLQNVPLWKIADEACRLKFSSYTRLIPNGIDNATQMCYGDDGTPRDTCAGDSGGPLQIKSKDIYCMYLILGVTSFGYTSCAQVGYPGVYTRVSHYVPWIESVVWP